MCWLWIWFSRMWQAVKMFMTILECSRMEVFMGIIYVNMENSGCCNSTILSCRWEFASVPICGVWMGLKVVFYSDCDKSSILCSGCAMGSAIIVLVDKLLFRQCLLFGVSGCFEQVTSVWTGWKIVLILLAQYSSGIGYTVVLNMF